MSWSPLRSGLLAGMGRDSPVINVWDIRDIYQAPRQPITPVISNTTGPDNGLSISDISCEPEGWEDEEVPIVFDLRKGTSLTSR